MKMIIVLTALLIFTVGTMVGAEEAVKKGAKKEESSEKAGTADFMASMWSKIVKTGKKRSSAVPTSVAGLRGAEQEKEEELEPYWKGREKSRDGAAMAEIEELVNKKEFASAIESLKAFAPSYPDSPLKPTAVLMLAYCYTQTGEKDAARSAFEGFLKAYPDHELAADARKGIEFLK